MLDERITATTLRFAVLGESLGHTWSPYIHNSLFAASGRDAVYLPITVPKEKLSSAIDVLRSCFNGFNVTIPYKERIIPLLDEVDDAVKACGAVNTVENRHGKLIGHITDGLGMMSAIQRGGVSTERIHALILGGGGAARVAGYEFLVRGGQVTFAVRDAKKGMRLADELSSVWKDDTRQIHVCALDTLDQNSDSYDILVNCTPVGMYPNIDASPVSEEVVARCGAVFDAVYNPRKTQLLSFAHARRIPCIEGLGMLFDQAVEAQRFWFGEVPSSDVLDSIYQALQQKL